MGWKHYSKAIVAVVFGIGQVLNVVIPLATAVDFNDLNGVISFVLALLGAYGVYQARNVTPAVQASDGVAYEVAQEVTRFVGQRLKDINSFTQQQVRNHPVIVAAGEQAVRASQQVAAAEDPEAALNAQIQAAVAQAVAAAMAQQQPVYERPIST